MQNPPRRLPSRLGVLTGRWLGLVSWLGAAVPGQVPIGAPMPQELATLSATPAPGSAAEVRWNLGKQAIAAGDFTAAQQHLLAALELHPCSPAVLLDLILAAGDNQDQQLLWCERFVRAAVDERGRSKFTTAARKSIPRTADLDAAGKLAQQRALAIAELVRFVEKQRPADSRNSAKAQLAGFASELLLAIGAGCPGPLQAAAPKVQQIVQAIAPDHDLVFEGLLRVMRQSPGSGDDVAVIQDRAIRAARLLAGLARQSTFGDLRGPAAPDMTAIAKDAREFCRRLDDEAQGAARVWTIAELEALDPAARERFTAEHDRWRHPGVALSLTGKYRIETTCGHQTLLAAAQTVELHHQRLAQHFGKDPFTDRPGIVRIVPESAELETEGAPYWWAAGFQSGDRTTVRFAWSDVASLGRLLTHELTHRFDGVLHPFLNAWYVEGHAVWTGGHYSRMTDTDFVDDHLQLGTVDQTWRQNYGRRDAFERLLLGTIDDYRDNYVAGYALYAYLRSFPPDGPPLFRDALVRFEQNARGGQRDPLGYFANSFCDGKDGRPNSLDAFVVGWQAFLEGVGNWLIDRRADDNRWVARYGKLEEAERQPRVDDRPTWSWARTRAEPFFGQDHAAAATRLLFEAGDHEATAAAGLWSIAVDGWRIDTVLDTLEAARRLPRANAAAAFAVLARVRFAGLSGSPDPTLLAAELPRCREFVAALAQRAKQLAADGAPVAAAALAAEHDLLATRLELPPLAELAAGAPPAVPTHLGGHGFAESSLLSFDDRRVPGLWFATPGGDLHVGREQPRDGTGTVDRRARQRDAFVRTVSWQSPGAYVLKGRVHFTTSFVRGAIVVGHWRRDRDVRLSFSSGDFDYAVGRAETNEKFDRINFRLDGMWERDEPMPYTAPRLSLQVDEDAAWFDYELEIRGPRLSIRINDAKPMIYTVHDGAPIEGHVGFAMGMGAIRVQQPTVQRLDATRAGSMLGLDLAQQPLVELDDLIGLPMRGIPHDPAGTLLLWLPKDQEETIAAALPRAIPVLAKLLNTGHEHPQPILLAVPKAMTEADRADVQRQIAAVRGQPVPVLEHDIGAPFTGTYPWVLFVDGVGVLRAAAEVSDPRFHSRVQRWSRMFRPR